MKLIWNYEEGNNRRFHWHPQHILIKLKVHNWERKAQAGIFAMFANLSTAAGDEVNVDITSEVVQHLGGLHDESVLYFPEIIKTKQIWSKIILLFQLRMLQYKDELIDLRKDSGAKCVFETKTICEFRLEVSDAYSNVRRKDLKIIPSKHFGESGYSTLFHVKTKIETDSTLL